MTRIAGHHPCAAESTTDKPTKGGKHAVRAVPQNHRSPQGDFSCPRRGSGFQGAFPCLGHLDRELVVHSASVGDAPGLVPSRPERMLVDGCRAGVEPEPGRGRAMRDGSPKNARGVDSRFKNFAPVLLVVTAIDSATGEVDEHVRTVEFPCPFTECAPIPKTFAARTI